MIDNETLAYFMCRTQQFLVTAGIDPKRLRYVVITACLPNVLAHTDAHRRTQAPSRPRDDCPCPCSVLSPSGLFIRLCVSMLIPSFRQHKATEMAHYAKDCWDAEVYTTYVRTQKRQVHTRTRAQSKKSTCTDFHLMQASFCPYDRPTFSPPPLHVPFHPDVSNVFLYDCVFV